MKEFQLTRYLRRWWWAIAVLSVLSGLVFYMYIASKQTYRAQILIEYTNPQASDGLYPSGDKIDVDEIRSSSVIWNALDSINRSDSVDVIRRKTTVSAVISDQDSAIQAAKWDDGLEYDFFPTQYIITYESDSAESASEARRILEAVVDSYINLFSSKYMSATEVPNSVESLRNLNYDYLEWAEIIDNFVNTDRDYLIKMSDDEPLFRSSQSGYSFRDLLNEYNLISSIYLPSLYAIILENHVTLNPELLIARYQYRKDQNDLAIKNYEEALAVVESMLETYTGKNEESIKFLWGGGESTDSDSTQAVGSNYMLSSVLRPENDSELNTYDNIIDRYIRLRTYLEEKKTDNEYCDYVFSAFLENGDGKSSTAADPEDIELVKSIISFIEGRLQVLDRLMNITTSEYIKIEAMKDISILSTVHVSETVNVKLYTALIVVVFFIFGVTIAVVIGRSLDFVEYHFYTDTTTDLPNHMACDNEIKTFEKKTLPVPFTVVVISLTNIKDINAAVGRDGGNEVLRVFAMHIKECSADFGFVGYNGSLTFLGLFPGCDRSRAVYYRNLLIRAIAEFNRGEHGVSIKFKLACSTATADNPRTIRELVSMAMAQLRIEKEVVAEQELAATSNGV